MNDLERSKALDEGSGLSRRNLLRTSLFGAAAGVASTTTVARAASTAQKPRWGFLIDLRKCVGCNACTVSCKTENDVALGVFRCEVKEYETQEFPAKRFFLPVLCNHCANPACLEPCPTKIVEHTWTRPDGTVEKFQGHAATFQRPDGIVLVDQDECYGCGACIDACPYDARYQDPRATAKKGPFKGNNCAGKCTLCFQRIDEGIAPACVTTCLAEARVAGDLNDPDSKISRILAKEKDRVEVLLEGEGTDPHCYYIRPDGMEDLDLIFEKGFGVREEAEAGR